MKNIILALFLLGCDSGGLAVRVDATCQNDAGSQNDVGSESDTINQPDCQPVEIGYIHSWMALILLPDGAREGMRIYLDGKLLKIEDWYVVYDCPNVFPHGDYLYISKRDPGDHAVAVEYVCLDN
jgi:hypothetical protein